MVFRPRLRQRARRIRDRSADAALPHRASGSARSPPSLRPRPSPLHPLRGATVAGARRARDHGDVRHDRPVHADSNMTPRWI